MLKLMNLYNVGVSVIFIMWLNDMKSKFGAEKDK